MFAETSCIYIAPLNDETYDAFDWSLSSALHLQRSRDAVNVRLVENELFHHIRVNSESFRTPCSSSRSARSHSGLRAVSATARSDRISITRLLRDCPDQLNVRREQPFCGSNLDRAHPRRCKQSWSAAGYQAKAPLLAKERFQLVST